MIKVGFIDYFLDEWHANNYPSLLKEHSGGEVQVCFAYGKIDNPRGGITNKEWSKKYDIPLSDTIEEVIEKSDVLVVLSPDNPEMHEELCELPLRSQKPVYIDKTFAEDKKTAIKIFEKAAAHGTACYSSSALRFSDELAEIDKSKIDAIFTEGPGRLEEYVIHQIEPVVYLMQTPVESVVFTGNERHPSAVVEFCGGKQWHLLMRNDNHYSYKYTVLDAENNAECFTVKSNYFGSFINELISFFKTGEIPVPHEQTIDVIAIREAIIKAAKQPFERFYIN